MTDTESKGREPGGIPGTPAAELGAEDFDQAYFDANYRNYKAQNPDWKLRFYHRVIERWAKPGHPRRLLDVGCGLGAFLGSLAGDSRYQLAGTDLSRFAVAHNRRNLPAVEFREASAAARPFPDGSFDVITAFDVLEHVPPLDEAGDAIDAMLAPGGLLVFVVPVYDGLSGPVIRRLDRDPTHVHKRDRRFWVDWAQRRFEVLEWQGMLRYLLPGGLYLHLPTRLGRSHTPAILVACRKRESGGAAG